MILRVAAMSIESRNDSGRLLNTEKGNFMKVTLLAMLTRFIPLLVVFASAPSLASDEFKGLEWLSKYRDGEGCIPLKELLDEAASPKECPKKFEPQIRPLTIGTLNQEKTTAAQKKKKALCCFDWVTHGNR